MTQQVNDQPKTIPTPDQAKITEFNVDSFTPRFIEACRREGVSRAELIKKSREEIFSFIKIKDPTGQILSHDSINQIEQHLEQRRLKKLQSVLEVRQKILQEEKSGQSPHIPDLNKTIISNNSSLNRNISTMSLVDKQNRLLENIQRKQQQEIQKMIEYEKKLDDIQKGNIEKNNLQQQKEQLREENLRLKRHEAEVKRLKQEEERRQKELKESRESQQRIKLSDEKEQQRYVKEQEKERLSKEEYKLKELDRINKQQKIQLEQDLFQKKQEEAASLKQSQMIQKDLNRQEMIDSRNLKRSKQAEQERSSLEVKLESVKKINEQQIQKKRDDYESRSQLAEKKRKLFEVQQELDKKLTQKESEQKQEQIRHLLLMNKQKEEQKITNYNDKVLASDQKKKDLEGDVKIEQEKKLQKYRDKEEKIRLVLLKNDQIAEKTKEQLVIKLDKTIQKLLNIDQKKADDLQNKFIQTLLKDIETQENLSHQENINVLKRERLESKLAKGEIRSVQLQKDKDQVIKLSEQIRKDAEEKRQLYMVEFELKRKTKDTKISKSFNQSHHIEQIRRQSQTIEIVEEEKQPLNP